MALVLAWLVIAAAAEPRWSACRATEVLTVESVIGPRVPNLRVVDGAADPPGEVPGHRLVVYPPLPTHWELDGRSVATLPEELGPVVLAIGSDVPAVEVGRVYEALRAAHATVKLLELTGPIPTTMENTQAVDGRLAACLAGKALVEPVGEMDCAAVPALWDEVVASPSCGISAEEATAFQKRSGVSDPARLVDLVLEPLGPKTVWVEDPYREWWTFRLRPGWLIIGSWPDDRFVKRHHSELEIKRRVNPTAPAAALLGPGAPLPEYRCLVTVYLASDGVPLDASASDCPKALANTSVRTVLDWRWFPPKSGPEPMGAVTTIPVTYRYPSR